MSANLESSGRVARLAEAFAWIDGAIAALPAVTLPLAAAAGRVLAVDLAAARDLPAFDRARIDGLALRADETFGAGPYNPVSFRLVGGVASHTGIPVAAGAPLPAGCDAVVALDQVDSEGEAGCAVIEAVAPGDNVERAAAHLARGAALLAAGRRLDAHDIALLAAAGCDRVPVVGAPRLRIALAGAGLAPDAASPDGLVDADGPLLRALAARDGSEVVDLARVARTTAAIAAAMAAPGVDLVLVVGATGRGSGDVAAAALAAAGQLVMHGIALHPGETAALGRTAEGVPVALLPGEPAACLWSYELIAGRLLRRLAGRDPEPPLERRRLTLSRKLVSAIGMAEICPVRRLAGDRVEPLPGFAEAGLAALAAADGFVLVPEGCEGWPPGAAVTVLLRPGHGVIHDGPRPGTDGQA